jgi:CheY-like chemotaxis protein
MSKLNDRKGQSRHQVRPSAESANMLAGQTVLVVETEIIIAIGTKEVVEALGASSVILARDAAEAQARTPEWSTAVLAVIELEVARPELIELARQVSQSGIRVLGISADTRLAFGVPELPGTPIVIKPIPDEDLARAIRSRLA